MNTKNTFRCLSAMTIISMAVIFTSCKEDEPGLATNDSQDVNSEAISDSYFEDAEDLSSTVSFASNDDLGGRKATVIDPRLECADITIETGPNENQGTITVDFGEGCTVNGITRKGKIIITYVGERRTEGSYVTTTFDGFYVNGIKIEGTRTVTVYDVMETYITHHIVLEDGRITWPDGSFAERDGDHYRKWLHNGTPADRSNDQVILLAEGSANGSNRNERPYVMVISEDIVFKASCLADGFFMPASGEKVLSIGALADRQIIVNYGDGDCNNTITVTIGSVTREVTVNR